LAASLTLRPISLVVAVCSSTALAIVLEMSLIWLITAPICPMAETAPAQVAEEARQALGEVAGSRGVDGLEHEVDVLAQLFGLALLALAGGVDSLVGLSLHRRGRRERELGYGTERVGLAPRRRRAAGAPASARR
jgi:hypothetical protein